DDSQVIKAGILEIGDVFAVNKADREGTDRTVMELEMMLDLAEKGKGPRDHDQGHQPLAGDSAKIPSEETGKPAFVSWRPPIIKTVARDGVGIEELLGALESHLSSLKSAGRWDALRQAMGEEELLKTATELAGRLIRSRAEENGYLRTLVAAVARREMDPFTAAEEVLRRALIAQEDQGRSR
ncbi:MAG: methylmalonyl Co-A mutase-associated GTPase MeaB, partial [Firmicutes bacterium]|nr:methylmalonyl Co-A mutase-associated GTPase MeaB [Bacillota bacterium]